jgi:predicted aspartyl protease/lipoprotein NlpI
MNRHSMALGALVVLLAVLALPVLAADPPRCKLAKIAEWPIRLQRGHPIVEGYINGKKVGVLLDTGAQTSLIMKSAAQKLELGTWMTSGMAMGFGGDSRVEVTTVGELRIGDAARKNLRVRVLGERPQPGIDFILGEDFFKNADLELDYANGAARVFQPIDCEKARLSYWDADALEVPMQNRDHVLVPVTVNGRDATAMIDSGAATSVVTMEFAGKLGITPQTPGVLPTTCASGLGADTVRQWVARFDSVAIAGETVRDGHINVADIPGEWTYSREGFDLILGADFLRANRVYISRYQQKVYFSYTGGQVFPATPGLECDARVADKDAKQAIATFDQAIAKNPDDTKARLSRAALRVRDDPKAALADLDAVLKVEPANAVALRYRAGAHTRLKEYDAALADTDAAMANGMRVASMYAMRAGIRVRQGDYEKAVGEYDEALKLDPHDDNALASRGHLLYETDRFEAAEKDFTTLLAMRSDEYDSIFLSLSRTRRGQDGRGALEQGLARTSADKWPAPVMLYLLGRIDGDALMAAAMLDEKKRRDYECEARFYTAQRLLADGKRDAARPLLEQARDQCPEGFVEKEGAAIQLAKYR